MSLPEMTIIGNLTRDPELRTTGNGNTVVNFTIAASKSRLNEQTNQWEQTSTLFLNCSAWDGRTSSLASNIAHSLAKGMRVIARGEVSQHSYQATDGTNRTVVEMQVSEIGPALSRATAQVQRMQSGQQGFQPQGGFQQQGNGWGAPPQQQAQAAQSPVSDPWSNPPDNQDRYRAFKGFGSTVDDPITEPEF